MTVAEGGIKALGASHTFVSVPLSVITERCFRATSAVLVKLENARRVAAMVDNYRVETA
jgi:hypothetical protein